MEAILNISNDKINAVKTGFERYLLDTVDLNERLIAIKGARGCGKTTMLLQYALKKQNKNFKVLYASLDDVYFYNNSLLALIREFRQEGGKLIMLDEVHKYPNWSVEIKNAYDSYDDLQIIFTGSSALQLHKAEADLSRRAAQYTLWGLSFREYLKFNENIDLPKYSLEQILKDHEKISASITKKIKPLAYFNDYLKFGYFPFFKEGLSSYHSKLLSTINLIIETDLPAIQNIDYSAGIKLKRLFYILSTQCPYKPNIQKLSAEIQCTRGTLLQYIDLLKDAHLINLLKTKMGSMSFMTKPDKVYLNNTNLMHAMSSDKPDAGTLRETFFFNQLNAVASINYTEKGDFLINNKYIFEVGGENKTYKQIKDIKNSYLALDKIENGRKNKIPLWLFGFLY
ncbi:MAG: ATP-binding protein [Sphingobacteriaceae bacterium]|nr:ATP-binding protein [Sphingobacteriaceae bacterium]